LRAGTPAKRVKKFSRSSARLPGHPKVESVEKTEQDVKDYPKYEKNVEGDIWMR
jgi:hypothetical protein